MEPKDLLDFIRQVPLFRTHSEQELGDVLRSAELRRVRSGELVFEQGDPGDRFFVVYSGRVRILARGRGEERKELNLGVIPAGGTFGETALITGEPRNAAARAVEDSVLLGIDRETFQRVLLATQEQRDTFERFIRSTSIHRFLSSCTDLAAVPAQELKQLVLGFQPVTFRAGDTVFRQGDVGDRFYLVERGKAKVVRTEAGEKKVLAFVHDGDFFGEKALFEDVPRHADVVCLTDLQAYTLTHEAFDALLRGTPRLRAVIEDRIRSYASAAAPPIAYQERTKQELAVDRAMEVEEGPADVAAAPPAPGAPRPSLFRRLRFPFIEQYDEMSCGTTCLMMIARYYGKEFSSARLRDLASVDQSGASLANLEFAAEQVGFATRALRLTYETLQSVHHPCIIHWRDNHYVVVYKLDARHAWVADPARGPRKLTREELCENWAGITLVLEPGPALARQKDERASIGNYVAYVKPYRAILGEIFLASILLNLLGLASPVFTQVVVDNVLGRDNPRLLDLMLVGMLLVLFFRLLVSGARSVLIAHTSMRMDLRMMAVFYRHLLALPLGYYKVHRIGDFVSRFQDNSKIREFLANTALSLVLDGVMILVCLALMLYYNAQLTLLALLLVPAVVLITAMFTPVVRRLTIDSLTAGAESGSELIEAITGIDTVKAMGLEHRARRRWEDKFTKALNLELRLSRTTVLYEGLGELVGSVAPVLLLWAGAYKVMQGAMSVGQLMAYMVLVGSIITPIDRVVRGWDKIQQTLVSINRLDEVLAATPELAQTLDDRRGAVLPEPRGEITYEKVFFRYGGQDTPYILTNVSVKIQPGQTVAVVGRSGSGKTTFVKLLPRFWEVTSGRILLDGHDVRQLNLADLRRNIGYVLQQPFLFDGTIRENIALSDPEETTARVVEAARLAHAHDFITSLPDSYDTRVGESGLQLSGGQKQRLAIAQVLYRNPRVVILDEATNALDAESEQAIQQNMEAILKGKTAIIIAHRLSTIRNADRILVFDNGEIVEQGTHEELMGAEGLYHYLHHQQFKV